MEKKTNVLIITRYWIRKYSKQLGYWDSWDIGVEGLKKAARHKQDCLIEPRSYFYKFGCVPFSYYRLLCLLTGRKYALNFQTRFAPLPRDYRSLRKFKTANSCTISHPTIQPTSSWSVYVWATFPANREFQYRSSLVLSLFLVNLSLSSLSINCRRRRDSASAWFTLTRK